MSDPARRRLGGPAVAMVFCFCQAAGADAVPSGSHPIVPGFERFASGGKIDPAGAGLLLLGELSCTACHRAGPGLEPHVARKQAPVLDGVGSRVRPAYLRSFLADPHAAKPGSTMPDPFHGWPRAEKAEAVEALTHFLASTGGVAHSRLSRKAVASGQALYHRVGCVVCHGPRGRSAPVTQAEPAAAGSRPAPLGDLAAKYTIPSLSAFLLDPLKARPSGRMPGLLLTGQEANEVAQFLLKDLSADARPNLAYRYYEGTWDKLPDLARLKPGKSGEAEGFDLSVGNRPGQFALRFEGFLRVDREGQYTFFLRSDDGSRLLLDDKLVVNNDGVHAPREAVDSVKLGRGFHRFAVEFFDAGGEAVLDVEIEGPGLSRQDVTGYLSLTEEAPGTTNGKGKPADPDRFAVDPELAVKGRELFARVGCASCHQLNAGGKPIAATGEARPLADLAGSVGGCLTASPGKGSPNYALSQPQRDALAAALRSAASLAGRKPSPEETVARTMTALNCYACHQRGALGGVEPDRSAFFETTQKEMGDEGRIPPHLNGVGAKLTGAYLDQVFASGAKDRPYMLTRMPRFGAANAGTLAPAFAALDTIEPAPTPEFEETPKKVKSAGRFLVGGEGLGCVKCHTFNGSQAEGVQAIDMTSMNRRLRRDWFHRYVVDPPAFRPGTRMPTGWPDGKSMLPKVFGGDAVKQVEAVWRYLADGPSATEPYGLGRELMPLFAVKEALIYRNFIRGGGTRAIGVGYPEKANLAFDANDLRIALIWQGGFIDASRHWSGRGDGEQPPMGDNVVTLPGGAPFASLSSPSNPWPTQPSKALGYRFHGYRLGKGQRPTFLYEFGATRVEDRPDAVAGKVAPGLKRTLTLTSDRPADDLWFRAAVGETVKPLADGCYLVNGEWKVRFGPDDRPVVRSSAGKQELIVPVRFSGKTATVVEQFEW